MLKRLLLIGCVVTSVLHSADHHMLTPIKIIDWSKQVYWILVNSQDTVHAIKQYLSEEGYPCSFQHISAKAQGGKISFSENTPIVTVTQIPGFQYFEVKLLLPELVKREPIPATVHWCEGSRQYQEL